MIAQAEPSPRAAPVSPLVTGITVAESHRNVHPAGALGPPGFALPDFGPKLERVSQSLDGPMVADPLLRIPAEWFLDNYYAVRRIARQIGTDLPRGFMRRLPRLASGPDQGLPRIYVLVRELTDGADGELDRSAVSRFIESYQTVTPLSIAELWALPTMLRSAVLDRLLQYLALLELAGDGSADAGSVPDAGASPLAKLATAPPLDPALGVERSIRELRLLAEIDWQLFFEAHSIVEAILQSDPAQIYALMDFDTCDDYRRVIEALAWNTALAEEDVARQAVLLASEAGLDPRRGHTGFYLVGEGRKTLEAQIGFHPIGLDRLRRAAKRFPTLAYFLPVSMVTAGLLMLLCWYATAVLNPGAPLRSVLFLVAAVCALTVLPIWSISANLVHWFFARLLTPRRLPKLDFERGVPQSAKTLVVIPAQLAQPEELAGLLRQLELHYLSNPDPVLGFALLTDYLDASEMPVDGRLLELATEGIERLNVAYGNGQSGPFLLLHRKARWNPAEGRFMGWERKRGKLEELNQLLRGDDSTTYVRQVGDSARLKGVRFVITLDRDTELPLRAAQRLIGLLAHPLNQAVFDPDSGRVIAGYTIVQPRLETSPTSTLATRFAQLFGGNAGFDIYTHASSELYQDLFGSGIYCGKGIYEVDTFTRSLKGRVPENRLASHDLFEGVHGRTALASDIVLYEQYPSHYGSYSRRLHRWLRGDWQLFPWLLPRVPAAGGGLLSNRLVPVDRWKIADNLRRSLVGPSLCLLLVVGWVALPLHPLVVTLFALGTLLAPLLPALCKRQNVPEVLARYALSVVFLLHEAAVVVDAVVRVVVRTVVTGKYLLQWTSAADTALAFSGVSLRRSLWQEMRWSSVLAFAITALVAWLRPSALLWASPLLGSWVLAPEVARYLSLPQRPASVPLSSEEETQFRLLARRTWLFFETFVGPADQWLPVDNYQEPPREQTAHRTSPTNIGLMLLSTLSAYDFGYIGAGELALRLRRSFDSIDRLTRYRGHLLNWYDTRDLEPLLPRYVSTVDSGNLAGCLVALKQGCRDTAEGSILDDRAWRGLGDSLALVEQGLVALDHRVERAKRTAEGDGLASALRLLLGRMHALVTASAELPLISAYTNLVALCDDTSVKFGQTMLAVLRTGIYRHEADHLHALRTVMESFDQQLHQIRREVEEVAPWLPLLGDSAAGALSIPTQLALKELPAVAQRLNAELAEWKHEQQLDSALSEEVEQSCLRLSKAFEAGSLRAQGLADELAGLAAHADKEAAAMDFSLLFDSARKLFHIGYNVSADEPDPNYYDLLASEARLASYFAIVKGDVPESHWYALGRPMTRTEGGSALLSWGGTMFEYLMPSLLMRSRRGTLLARSAESAVRAQIAYGARKGVPWGISESSFSCLDAHETYQYRSFGVPGLGFKRDLEDDLVVTPYASMLALSVQPKAVADNLERLYAMGMGGDYGLFEAMDFNPVNLTGDDSSPFNIVKSYMAHHQGMLLVALNNHLNLDIMVERFHADAAVGSGEMLLNERAPDRLPAEWPLGTNPSSEAVARTQATLPMPVPWTPDTQGRPQAFVFGNGRLSTTLTARGGGGLSWRGLALTRYQPDATRNGDGVWFYVRDEDSKQTWLATSEQGRTTYSAHEAEFHQRDHEVSVRVEIVVAPADDVEVRRVTLHNESARIRRLSLTSAGEPVLLPRADAASHPAFGRLFIESEFDAALSALIFTRRRRGDEERQAILVHRLVWDGNAVAFGGYQSDRSAFYGRCQSDRLPRWLTTHRSGGHGRVGWVIDPIMAITADVVLAPNQSASFAFVTAVARSRSAAIDLAARYGSMQAVRWAFQDAHRHSPGRLARAGFEPTLLPAIQRLFSALLFMDPTFRNSGAAGPVVDVQLPHRNAFWGQGLSGDLPIVVLLVGDPVAPLIAELAAAQRYLRSCGFDFDYVALDEAPSGYVTDGQGTLRHTLLQADAGDWLHRPGGVHLLSADQLDDERCKLLEATATVLLNTASGTLSEQMNRPFQPNARLPRFEPTRALEADSPAVADVPPRQFDNELGGFSEDGREYLITVHPDRPTPAPWCNVLANPQFGCLVSESALGSTWAENAGENRLTPWRNDPVLDTPSEVLYLRDEETAAIWSATPLPAGGAVQTQVQHGAGYTSYVRESHGLEQELTVFVPPDATLKVARLRLKNLRPRDRRLLASYYVEWVFGQSREETLGHIVSEFNHPRSCLLASCDWNTEFKGRVAFLAGEHDLHGLTTDRTEFLGSAGNYALPDGLTRWGLSGAVVDGGDPCAAVQMHLELGAAGGAKDEIVTHFILGQCASREEALDLVARYRQPDVVEAAWQSLHVFWDDILGGIRVETPEPAMDLLLNRWLLYQALSSRVFGRTGFYQSSGAFGFRDQLQDVLALFHAAPQRARAHILEAATHQFEEGDVLHWWHPPSGRGVRTRCSDDMAWLPYVVSAYVSATGDAAILKEPLAFLQGAPLEDTEDDRYEEFSTSPEVATLLEHCRRALECALTVGPHGLPLMAGGDWNDGMNRVGARGIGESVWLGWFLCDCMNRFAKTCEAGGAAAEEAASWRHRAEVLRIAIEASSWDGAWYLRAFHDDGSVLGSEAGAECKIDSIAQSWAVLSGVGDQDRAGLAMQGAREQLVDERNRLVLLLRPPFDTTLHDPGYIAAYPPGVRENGGQYTHAATWLGLASARQGDGDGAAQVFRLINPILRSRTAADAERYRAEPYVLTGDVYSSAPWVGRGGWSWYTGSAAWMYQLGMEAILGLRQVDGALCVDPCIPSDWPGFESWVRVAGKTLHVRVENPDSVSGGIASIALDGVTLNTNRITAGSVSGEQQGEVVVILGAPNRQITLH